MNLRAFDFVKKNIIPDDDNARVLDLNKIQY